MLSKFSCEHVNKNLLNFLLMKMNHFAVQPNVFATDNNLRSFVSVVERDQTTFICPNHVVLGSVTTTTIILLDLSAVTSCLNSLIKFSKRAMVSSTTPLRISPPLTPAIVTTHRLYHLPRPFHFRQRFTAKFHL
ncbi:hypothetical protein ISN44_As07g024570 [Arabidopsis suecica]|uniref:Uncharacterized protein n=1 Tax=Arabidopsis suecica TaxID=45249 RepID=A0A8T2BZF8_ARASU|nr:hypothetical protein ISN44_As07g024570 [Arabidopsis suecica]